MLRRLVILLLAVLTLVVVPAAAPAFAAQAPDAPADGPSGAGNNPASGQSGGGAEAPSSKGGEGNGLLPVVILGAVVLVVGSAVAIGRRHRQVSDQSPGR